MRLSKVNNSESLEMQNLNNAILKQMRWSTARGKRLGIAAAVCFGMFASRVLIFGDTWLDAALAITITAVLMAIAEGFVAAYLRFSVKRSARSDLLG